MIILWNDPDAVKMIPMGDRVLAHTRPNSILVSTIEADDWMDDHTIEEYRTYIESLQDNCKGKITLYNPV